MLRAENRRLADMQTSVVAQAEVQSPIKPRPKSLPTVPALLFRLILVCLLPALIGGGIMIYMEYERGRTQQQASVVLTVRDKLDAVDAQLAQAELFAQALATDGALTRQDFAAFHQRSVLLGKSDLDRNIILYDASGQQLLNSNTPYGERLPKRQDLAQIQSVFSAGRMVGPTVISRTADGHSVVGITAPIFSGQKVAYALAVNWAPKILNDLLAKQSLQTDAIAAILDSEGNIATRSVDAEKFMGKKIHPELLKQLALQAEGSLDLTTAAGIPLWTSYRRSARSGWTVIISIPHQSIATPLTHNLVVLCLGGTLLLVLSLGSAWLVGTRIAKSVQALQAAAMALGAGTLTTMPAVAMLEANELGQALQASAILLKRRTRELLLANETLLDRSTELTEAQHIAKIGNWKWEARTGVIFASEELQRLYGQKILLPFAEQRGTVYPEKGWQELETAAKDALQNKTGFSLLLPTLSKDGTQIWARINANLVCNSKGDVTGLRGTLQDMDLSVKSEMALQVSESRLSLAMSNSNLALWDWNIPTDELFSDANFGAMTAGYTAQELPTSVAGFMLLIHPEDQAQVQAGVEAHFKGEVTKLELTYRAQHKSGHYVWLHISGKVVERDAKGNPVRLLGVGYDITERKQYETAMKALQNELDATLVWQVAQHTVAALAHEVNQPLASASILCEAANRMLAAARMLDLAKAENPNRLETTLQRIASDIERAGSILKNLLKSLNKPDITRSPAAVNGLVAESIQAALEERSFGHRIVTDYGTDLPLVNVNRLQVIKVLLNLIQNSAQAMHGARIHKGKIWVSTSLTVDGSEICVSVRDEGPGISASLQQEIFQPFITTKPNGLGMGLTISRALIDAHDGKLWHSQEGGLGASFHFTLPISS